MKLRTVAILHELSAIGVGNIHETERAGLHQHVLIEVVADVAGMACRDVDVHVAVGVTDDHAICLRSKILLESDVRSHGCEGAIGSLQVNLVSFRIRTFHGDDQVEISVVVDVTQGDVLVEARVVQSNGRACVGKPG